MSILDERFEWLEKRTRGIGGTDIGAILGVSPWSSPIDVYLGKVGLSAGRDMTEAMWWGSFLEEGISKKYAEREGKRVLRGSAFADLFPGRHEAWMNHTLIHHKEFPHFLGTPDGVVCSPDVDMAIERGLEIKNSGFKSEEWGTAGTDHVPTHYLLQCQWYEMVTGINVWDLAVLFSGNRLEVYTIHANTELQQTMAEFANEFWENNVLKEIPPPVDASEGYASYLAKKFSSGTEEWVEAKTGDNFCLLAGNLRRIQGHLKEVEEEERLAKSLMMESIGERKGVKGPFGKVQWIRSKPSLKVDFEGCFLDLVSELKMEDEKVEEIKATHTTEAQRNAFIRAYFKEEE